MAKKKSKNAELRDESQSGKLFGNSDDYDPALVDLFAGSVSLFLSMRLKNEGS